MKNSTDPHQLTLRKLNQRKQELIIIIIINCDRPSRKAILKLRNGKATGPDDIHGEALKTDIDTTAQ